MLWTIVGLGTPPQESRTPNQAAAEEDARQRNIGLGDAAPTEAFYAAERAGPDEWQVVFHDGKPAAGLRGLITSFNRAVSETRNLPPT